MAGLRTDSDWSLLFVEPPVVNAVASLLEGFAACKEDYTPTDFLRAVFEAAEKDDGSLKPKASNRPHGLRLRIPRKQHRAFGHEPTRRLDASNRNATDKQRLQKSSATKVTDSEKKKIVCDYPEICKTDLSNLDLPGESDESKPALVSSGRTEYKYMGCACTSEDLTSTGSGSLDSDSIEQPNTHSGVDNGGHQLYPEDKIRKDVFSKYFQDKLYNSETHDELVEGMIQYMTDVGQAIQKMEDNNKMVMHDSDFRCPLHNIRSLKMINKDSDEQTSTGNLNSSKTVTDSTDNTKTRSGKSQSHNSQISDRYRADGYCAVSRDNAHDSVILAYNAQIDNDWENNDKIFKKSSEFPNEEYEDYLGSLNNFADECEDENESRPYNQITEEDIKDFKNKTRISMALNDECSKSNIPKVCAMFEERELDTESQKLRDPAKDDELIRPDVFYVRLDEDYKQAAIKLFLLILDHEEFLAIAIRSFCTTSRPRIYVNPAFFRVLAFLLFFNLNPRSFEGIKQNLLDAHPVKSLLFVNYIMSDDYKSCLDELLRIYDTDFVTEHAYNHVKGDLMAKMQEAITEFLEERKTISMNQNSVAKEEKPPCETKQIEKAIYKQFQATPLPATTFIAPRNKFYTSGTSATVLKPWDKCSNYRRKDDSAPLDSIGKIPKSQWLSNVSQPPRGTCVKPDTETPPDSSVEKRCAGCFSAAAPPRDANPFAKSTFGKRLPNEDTVAKQEAKLSKDPSQDTESTTFNAKPGFRFYRDPPKFSKVTIPVKPTAASVLREGARLRHDEQRALQKLDWVASGGADVTALEEMLDKAREEEQLRELEAIERKHLQGLLSYEEAVVARRNHVQRHREKVLEFKKEKEQLERQLEAYRKEEEEKIKLLVDKGHQIQNAAREKSKEIQKMKNDTVQKMIKETKGQLEEVQRQRQEELNQRIALIRELRALQGLTKLKKREVDFTETPGYGFMYEMSIAELQERLNLIREELREEIERKRIRAQNIRAQKKQYVQDTQVYINQQRQIRVPEAFAKKSQLKNLRKPETEELQQLREKLNETRKLRQGQSY